MMGIVGAGAMGSALAVNLSSVGHEVALLGTPQDGAIFGAHLRGEPHPAIGVPLPPDVMLVDPDGWLDVLPKLDVLLIAVATTGLASTVGALAPHAPETAIWGIATKGWEEATLRSAHDVVSSAVGDADRVVAISGPSLAIEIAGGVPTGLVCASRSLESARRVAEVLRSPRFRTYVTTDVAGVEVGAMLKNVVAIGIGMCDGLGPAFGVPAMTNAKALIFSRGLIEMSRMATALGGRPETVLGLAGAGDLFVTVLGGRNGRFGRLIGEGQTPEQALRTMNTTVEGYVNARTAATLAARYGLVLPVVHSVIDVLHNGLAPALAIERLVAPAVEEEL